MYLEEVLLNINSGAPIAEITREMERLLSAIKDTGKGGSLTLTVSVAPFKGSTDAMCVTCQVKTKIPEPERGVALFFLTEDNRLVRNDPRQQQLPLRSIEIVPVSRGELKEVG